MRENIGLAFQGIWGHKMRSVLTMLGIIIGIASIITIVSTIHGTNEQIKESLIGSGNNVVLVRLNKNRTPLTFDWQEPPEGVRCITEKTRQELEEMPNVERAALYTYREYCEGIYYRSNAFYGCLYGIDSNYLDTYQYQIKSGRGFTQADHDNHRKVVLLDEIVAESLFAGEDPVGKTVEIASDAYIVVGVVGEPEKEMPAINTIKEYEIYAKTGNGTMYVPHSVWPGIYRYEEPQCVAVRVDSTDAMAVVGKEIADYLTNKQILSGDSELEYRSQDMLEKAQQLQKMSQSTNSQLIWIASISLLVGGIGVMNIMLVSVTERTAEIGLKKAIGAKKKRILLQFLTESAVLTSLGGVIGVISGIILAQLISRMMQIPVAISVPAIAVSVVFSTLIGVVFGMLPAVQAANLNPIEALRRE